MRKPPSSRCHLVGIGLDHEDGHARITRAEDFSILGGSEQTHERMTETVIKTVEDLSRKGKTLHNADPEELRDLVQKHAQS
jgi:hypothetical protein